LGADHGSGDRQLPEWFGSLIQGKQDQTGVMHMRNRYYDPNSGRFTQEDPIGLAGGLNLYGFAGGDPVNFSDPFGLCKNEDGTVRDCKVEISPEEKAKGASLEDVKRETLKKLHAIAVRADVDLGLNSTTGGEHVDKGHAGGTAVDIGWINGMDIGNGSNTNPGMLDLATKVQEAAAQLGELKPTGNLGPAGKFIGTKGPMQIMDRIIRAAHMNHIHLSFIP
jgi:RHS repeat-associated protein